jgi:hypoxanthine phosphoribosyltransferase
MKIHSYDYKNRKGIKVISWTDFSDLIRSLAEKLGSANIDIIIGIARAGLIPATAIACMLRKEMFQVRLTRRYNDEVITQEPEWKIKPPPHVLEHKVVCIIDEIADTGRTLELVKSEVKTHNPERILTVTLISHSWADPKPDYTAIETDQLIIFPWDHQVIMNGEWKVHPEIERAIILQNDKSK